MDNPSVSIIIPVYKTPEPLLRRCLESAAGQTGVTVEILAVDDASPDGCPAVLDEFAARDARIRVIHRTVNGRAGLARNNGLDLARGEFIFFADADDFLQPDLCARLTALAQTNCADMVTCSSSEVTEGGQILRTSILSDRLYDLALMRDRDYCFRSLTYALWNKLFRRAALGGLRFEPFAANIGEDTLFNVEALCRCRRMATTSYSGYAYTVLPESASHRKAKGMPYLETLVQSQERMRQALEKEYGSSGRRQADWLGLKRYITGCEWIAENPDPAERNALWKYWREYFVRDFSPAMSTYGMMTKGFRLLGGFGNTAATARLMRLTVRAQDRLLSLILPQAGSPLSSGRNVL